MRRIVGILLIIRAFTPILIALVVIWALGQMSTDLQKVMEEPIANIEEEILLLESDIAAAQAQFETMKTHITDALSTLQNVNLSDLLPDFPASLDLNGFSIPDLTIPIPTNVEITWHSISANVTQRVSCSTISNLIERAACEVVGFFERIVTQIVQYPSITVTTSNFTVDTPALPDVPSIPFPPIFEDLASEIANLFDGFGSIFSSLDSLFTSLRALGTTVQNLPENLQGIVTEGETLLSNIKIVFEKWDSLLLVALILVGTLLVVYFAVPIWGDLGRGLAMVFNESPPNNDLM